MMGAAWSSGPGSAGRSTISSAMSGGGWYWRRFWKSRFGQASRLATRWTRFFWKPRARAMSLAQNHPPTSDFGATEAGAAEGESGGSLLASALQDAGARSIGAGLGGSLGLE